MTDFSRRDFLATAAAGPVLLQNRPNQGGGMFVCMHEASSDRFDFRVAMEGWAKAGIRAVEPTLTKVRDWAEKQRGKFEDLELLRDGELHHLHFEDVPDTPPREIQGQPHRAFPGEGIAPLRRIVEVLKKNGYAGPASFESFNPQVQSTDPYEIAMRARKAIGPLIA